MGSKKISAAQWLTLSFLILILSGSILLYLPWASADGHTNYIDCLFVAASATCVTGLVPVDTSTNWTLFGHIVILLLIQVGGLGVMAFAAFFALLLGQKIQLRQRLVMQQAINVSAVGGVVRVFRYLLRFTFLAEGLGALILTLRWSGDFGWAKAAWFGVFHAISAFNNAGFDLMGGFKSLTDYSGDVTINLVISALIILGGLGFYVTYELYNYPRKRCLSIHSKVVLIMTAVLILVGTLLLFIGEYNHALKGMPLNTKILASYFQSVTPRTAGFNTIDITKLYLTSNLVIILLMFVGASPGSTGGGIKTSTFAIIWLAIYSQLRGKKDTEIFERRLENQDVMQALTVFMLFTFTLVIMTFLVSLSHQHDLVKVLFEVASALGTVGLTLGLTPDLTVMAKVWIIITMFLGRVGPLTLGFALAYKEKQPEIHYPIGKIMIG
ncbi:TrkH family potassium uptake protein [Syntrophomonas palmitatica]|uniref:TrkH family potassium uptake protein n=1 Tax=Syntrophomonas palmitatica TaxID=402877 RepID=UPI0006D0210A|nr:TrkH family potassium uptake protein [Syntrophomonas palmitatica]